MRAQLWGPGHPHWGTLRFKQQMVEDEGSRVLHRDGVGLTALRVPNSTAHFWVCILLLFEALFLNSEFTSARVGHSKAPRGTPPEPGSHWAPSARAGGLRRVSLTHHGVQKPHVVQEARIHLPELPEVHFHQDGHVVPGTRRGPLWSCRRAQADELQAQADGGQPGAL